MNRIHAYWQFILIPPLAATGTVLCRHFSWLLEMRTVASIVFAGIFFTFAITIGTANKRRFDALDELAAMKAYIISFGEIFTLFLPQDKIPCAMDDLRTFFPMVKKVMMRHSFRLGPATLRQMDIFFNELLNYIFLAKKSGLGAPEVSRLLQWHQALHYSFERLLAIKEYNTPVTLRRFVLYTLLIAIFVLSPEFARMGWMGVVGSYLITFMILALNRIQAVIEDPFGDAVDQIHFFFIERIQERLTRYHS